MKGGSPSEPIPTSWIVQDLRVIQRSGGPGFIREAPPAIGIRHPRCGQDLQGDIATEPMIVRAIDLAHPPGAQERDNLKRSESRAWNEQHLMQLIRDYTNPHLARSSFRNSLTMSSRRVVITDSQNESFSVGVRGGSAPEGVSATSSRHPPDHGALDVARVSRPPGGTCLSL